MAGTRTEPTVFFGGVLALATDMPMAAVLRTRTIAEPRGFMKLLVAADSDEILGFTAFGAEATELLAAVQTAMAGGLPYTTVGDAIYTHPTMSEAMQECFHGLTGHMINF